MNEDKYKKLENVAFTASEEIKDIFKKYGLSGTFGFSFYDGDEGVGVMCDKVGNVKDVVFVLNRLNYKMNEMMEDVKNG